MLKLSVQSLTFRPGLESPRCLVRRSNYAHRSETSVGLECQLVSHDRIRDIIVSNASSFQRPENIDRRII